MRQDKILACLWGATSLLLSTACATAEPPSPVTNAKTSAPSIVDTATLEFAAPLPGVTIGLLSDSPALNVREIRVAPCGIEARHYHEHMSHFVRVLAGEVTMVLGEDIVTLSEGQSLDIPPLLRHGVVNLSETQARVLVASTPNTPQDRFIEPLDEGLEDPMASCHAVDSPS